MPSLKSLTEGQRAYEAKRAAKAGMSLEKWLASKEREREADAKAEGRGCGQTEQAAWLFQPASGTSQSAARVLIPAFKWAT